LLAGFRDPRMLVYDPASAGLLAAREQVAGLCRVDADRVVLTTRTSEAYSWLFKLLCDPGDEILAPKPSYPLFEFLAALEAVRIVQYPLVYHGSWSIDFDALQRGITARTRAIVVVNPNNPTGSYLKLDELRELAGICNHNNLALISDEVFSDYALTPDARLVSTLMNLEAPTTFCLNGLSKLIGMPQMKLGWIVTNDSLARERLELIADTYLSVGTPVQYAFPHLLGARESIQAQIMDRLRSNLQFLQSQFAIRKVEGGWYAILQAPRVRTEEQWVLELLERYDVLVQPGYFYDFESEAFLVLSLLTAPDIFREGVKRLRLFVDHS
ncbi:MAG: aminotransferase, partial [Bryobacterales bacterium]|nr:aminotransferase [Bryobacterales bacterium]